MTPPLCYETEIFVCRDDLNTQETNMEMGAAVIGGRMRDSIKLRSRPRRAGDEQGSTGALHLDRFESLSSANKKPPSEWMAVFVGRG